VSDILACQQKLDLFQPFPESLDRFIGRDAEAAELMRQEGAGEADIETAARQRIDHADLTGELQRMVEDRQHGAGDKAHPARA